MSPLLKYWAISILFELTICVGAFSQAGLSPDKQLNQFNFDHWTSEDGLPDNAITYLTQAKNGYIWFASYGGITRFNGIEFYTFNSYNTPELINNSFTHIYEDKEGVIWSSSSGNGVATINGNQVKVYNTDHGLPSNFVEEVVQDQDKRLWVATSKGLVYKENNRFVNNEVPDPLKTLTLKSIDCDEKNHLWIATIENGVYELYRGKVLNHYTTDNGLLSNNINYVNTKNGHVWIGSGSGLNTIAMGRVIGTTIEDGLPNNMITSSYFDNQHQLWVGSYAGFCRISLDGYQYLSQNHPLYGRDITSIMEDEEGNLWVSTYRAGLFKFWEGKFTNYSDYEFDLDIPFTVHTVIPKSDQELVLVHEDGVGSLNLKTGLFSEIDLGVMTTGIKFKYGLRDSQNRYWLATKKGVICYQNGKSDWLTVDDGLIDNNIRVIFEDSQGNIWIGTFFGITRISKNSGELVNFTTDNGLSHVYIMSIMEDSEHNIWVGTKTGLHLFEDGKFKVYNAKDGLAGDFVFKSFEDKENVMWVASNAGLSRYKDGKFNKITVEDGLISNTIFQVLEDDHGYLWFTTNQRNTSVYKVLKSELNDFCDGKIEKIESIEYAQKDGIISTAATSSATSLKTEDGKLWFATHNGVESIDPGNIKINNRVPPVVIEKFEINDVPIDIKKRIILNPGKKRINIRFAGLSYIAPEHIKFKYQLVGYDDGWVEAGDEHETSYTNLPHGEYSFKVIAANSDGLWNNEGAKLSFSIKPAYYETSWFYVLAIFLLIVIIRIIYNLRVKSLTRSRTELEKLVNQRTSEIEAQKEEIEAQRTQIEEQNNELITANTSLEDKVQERTEELKKTYGELLDVNKEMDTFIYRSVHDVRGPIARLQGLSQLLGMESKDEKILYIVDKLNDTSDEMNDVFYRLLNIVRLKSADLSYTKIDIKELIENVLDRFHFNIDKVQLSSNLTLAKGAQLLSSRETIDLILYQLVDNAIKFKKPSEPAKVDIEVIKNNSTLTLTVSDYGVGIPKRQATKIFDMFYVGHEEVTGAGLGLYTVKTAVKVLNGQVRLVSNAISDSKTTFEVVLYDKEDG